MKTPANVKADHQGSHICHVEENASGDRQDDVLGIQSWLDRVKRVSWSYKL